MGEPRIVSVFNNKGGVGKTTLTYHLGHALAALGHKTLFVDLDPQCNLTIHMLLPETIDDMWRAEDPFIELGFDEARKKMSVGDLDALNSQTRSIHYLMQPTAEGTGDLDKIPPPAHIAPNLDLIPGRLTLHMFEERLSRRWNDLYSGDPLAIRTASRIRTLILQYAAAYGYEIVLVDTSPSLGVLNKVIISTADAFLVPCLPDVFSLYGIRNIGKSLTEWIGEFQRIYGLLSEEKRAPFPTSVVQFIGFTIFNAKKYTATANPWNLAKAHYNYAQRIPETISRFVPKSVRGAIADDVLREPVGGVAVMHTHNTLPAMAHKYRLPIWSIPGSPSLEHDDRNTVLGNRNQYEATFEAYKTFAEALLARLTVAMQRPKAILSA